MKSSRRQICKRLGAIALGFGMVLPAAAQDKWPTQPIKLVVPFAAGGATDQVARLVASKMGTILGTTVIIDNRTGANGNIGAELVAKAAPDGYTFLHTTSSIAFTAAFRQKVHYDLSKDLQPVTLAVNQPLLIMSSLQSGVVDAATLRQYLRKNDNKVSYASSGNGNLTHLAMYVILHALGADATHIPYKGGAAAFPDVIAGRVDLFSDPINSAFPHVREKRVTALAVTGAKRSALAPDVPTVDESLLPGFTIGAWQAVFAPAGTSPEIVAKVRQAYRAALRDPAIKAKLASEGAEAVGSSGEELKSFMDAEIKRWEKVVQTSGIKLD
ncbi:Tripartite-type tricarboxylate transporter, receptor component TctC [Variovorax sp. HW608]|uniref:Bug family tripartite tricarboxylate transporter substrate binding protein n=1 Tax=Variovorax sp. HW608 TaxID=1034889 RepID=UPI00082000AF|nr:tripartite tricarboxylate transporter substrate binding protein [Variovorax sp. HW608]SCK26067.1 Tripartite-type tricarboxylate transporter, receptor component TctC [Variovorax sp. HW608]